MVRKTHFCSPLRKRLTMPAITIYLNLRTPETAPTIQCGWHTPVAKVAITSVVLACCLWPLGASAQKEVEYRERAYGFEGVKANPVSGFDVELLSARVDYEDSPSLVKDQLQLRFFLDRARPVNVVVRELDQKYYYWLDKVRPQIHGVSGFGNTYHWPTDEVIRKLGQLRPYDLGVVVRLDKDQPGAVETVAPPVFYQSKLPTEIKGYSFSFRLRDDSKVKATVYEEANGAPVIAQDLGKQRGGRPFTFKWNLATAPAKPGFYRVVLSGYVADTNSPVSQVVRFFHAPLEK